MPASLLQESRFALRALARAPWFTATCVLMLAAERQVIHVHRSDSCAAP
jgi:hypothetical protein